MRCPNYIWKCSCLKLDWSNTKVDAQVRCITTGLVIVCLKKKKRKDQRSAIESKAELLDFSGCY